MSVVADVPLVEDQQRRAAGPHRQLRDPQVLRGDPVGGVADDDRDVGPLDRPLGAQLGVVVDRAGDLRAAAQSGGVDQDHRRPSTSSSVSIASRVVPARSETITRSLPRKALTSEDLPTLGRPITAMRTGSSPRAAGGQLAERLDDPVEQVAGAEPVRGRDRDRLAEAELVELGGDVLVARAVDFVDDDEDRDVAAAQRLRQLGVAGPDPGAAVDDEQDRLGLGDPDPGLALHVRGQLALVGEVDPAGVEQVEGDAVPLAGDALAVAGDARLGVRSRPRGRRRAG